MSIVTITFGEGELNLKDYLDLANNHHCRVVIEVKTIERLKKSVEWMNRTK